MFAFHRKHPIDLDARTKEYRRSDDNRRSRGRIGYSLASSPVQRVFSYNLQRVKLR